jgi:hypothetical protein
MARKVADPVKLNLRFTEGLRSRLEKQATKNNHSLNAEIVRRLEASFEKDDRIAMLRGEMEKRVEDYKHRYDVDVTAFRRISLANRAAEAISASEQALERRGAEAISASEQALEWRCADFERTSTEATRAAAVVDVFLGGSKLKSDFFRSLALELADVSEDWLAEESNRRQLIERAVAELGGAAK